MHPNPYLKVYMQIAVPDRPIDPGKDGHFLCYDSSSPIPWDKKIFVVTDNRGRNWFCHDFNHHLSQPELQKVLATIYSEYPAGMKRTCALVIQIVASRAGDLDELRHTLSKVDLKGGE